MNRNKAPLVFILLASFGLAACSGKPGGVVCTVNCGGGSANLSFTLVADHLPAHPSILSFKVIVSGITVTSSTATLTLTPPSTPIDLMRLQSDSAFLGTLHSVPSETISSLTVALAAQDLTFFNDTGVALTNPICPINTICSFNPGTINAVLINNLSQAFSANTGFGIDFNLANAITLTGTTLTVNFNNSATTNVLTSFLLPRSISNLGSGQLDLIEDFTGVVGISGNTVTITSPTRGVLTTTSTSTSFFDQSPDGTLCHAPGKLASCVINGQIASVDAFLNTDGTLSLKEFEPLNATQQDFVEGTVFAVNNPTQFGVVVTDKVAAATNSLIGGLNTGDLLTVNISTNPVAKPFFVDSKSFIVPAGSLGLFQGQADTTAIHPGQTVAVHVTTFTAATPTVLAIATVDTITLRWSRFTATPNVVGAQTLGVTSLPSYFGQTIGNIGVQLFSGTQGQPDVTNFDGVSDGSQLVAGNPASFRALFIENSGNSAAFPLFAAKVRQH
jgi:hypothetical protein